MPRILSAVVAGHICIDLIPDLAVGGLAAGQPVLQPGRLTVVGPLAAATGGSVPNVGLALHKLGVPTLLMGRVGNDLLGQAVLRLISANGSRLAETMIVEPTTSTSYTVILSAPGVDRAFLHYPGANDTFSAADVQMDRLVGSHLFHFGYPPLMRRMFEADGAELVALFRRVKSQGLTTSLDMAQPDPASPAGRADWRAIFRSLMPYVDIFLPSVEETLFALRRDTHDELVRLAGGRSLLPLVAPELLSDLADELLTMGARIVGLKLGDRGLYLRTGLPKTMESMGAARPSDLANWAGQELWAPCFRAQVVGTTGSGDATIAGFLAALSRDSSLEQAATAAVAVGASNVEAADALSGIRSWEETWQRVAAGWPRHTLSLTAPDWRFDPYSGLWRGPAGRRG